MRAREGLGQGAGEGPAAPGTNLPTSWGGLESARGGARLSGSRGEGALGVLG